MIGGSSGIGLAIAKELHTKNNLFVASRTNIELKDLQATHIPFDALTDTLTIAELPNDIDGFVYCPGSINLKPLKMISMDTFYDDMQLNFFSLAKASKEIISKMKEGSSMVFFSTVAVQTGMPYHTSIAAAKGAVEGFARALAAECAPKIRVNVIAPSLVDTPLAKKLLSNDQKKESMAIRHPLKRIGEAIDIANLAVFLLSDKSSWMTGQVIHVDGGLSRINLT